MQKGFTLIELLVVLAVLAILMAIAIPLMQDAMLRANTSALATDAKAIYTAFKQYYVDNNLYPGTGGGGFDVNTFEPLLGMGYYSRPITTRLRNFQADGYDSPNGRAEFWLEITLRYDDRVRFLVSDSDGAPLAGGTYYDGIYLFLNGVLSPIGTRQ
jgi:prepilin-type N-terminal cleavage/methylation domain-containing protein